jgi:hypothetical protein
MLQHAIAEQHYNERQIPSSQRLVHLMMANEAETRSDIQ